VQVADSALPQTIRNREDTRRYVRSLDPKNARNLPSVKRWRRAGQVTLLLLLGYSAFQLYFLSIFVEILSLPGVTVFVPLLKGGIG
jgi:hypothetical protein